ncbi:outer membrane protein assembly factor BamB family protein [Paractinoplanes atraurantiacus]|uniref:PQQ-like domain-containing protein n=1 Tax=Paractinoplanes atraurantiacus TaxID=1036182 RepID=A0A285FSP2_9ACTN|nr:PQQ-binding-like beta-propeller repeat protein [Actinoplanes atraurantiacus]SNY14342.1 PQQ-like domain-containing protein [Actinoplanes atraurantiacus]
MPADLDDMLAQLGRDADSIPLAGAPHARQRGRQRTHRQAGVSAALAVCLVAVGVGVALYRPHRETDRTVSPTPSSRALTEVGSPVNTGGPASSVAQAVRDGKLFSAWVTPGGEMYLNAADLHTGAVLWDIAERAGAVTDVRALPGAVMVRVERSVAFYDPANGDTIRRFQVDDADELVPYDNVLVRLSASNGQVVARDLRTGRPAWSDTSHPTARVLSDGDRLIQVTKAGQILVRNAAAGTVLRTITPAKPPGSQFLIAGGRLFHETIPCCDTAAYRIVATDLTTGKSDVILSAGPERFIGMDACGTNRLCILDAGPQNTRRVTALDVVSRRQLWRSPAPDSSAGISANGENVLVGGPGTTAVLLAPDGSSSFRTPDASVSWLGDDKLLMTPALAAGPVTTYGIADRRLTRLGDLPRRIGPCVNTADRLACPTEDSLRLWSLTG